MLITRKTQEAISKVYEGLGWAHSERVAFCREVCGVPWAQTEADGTRLVQQLKRMKPISKKKVQGVAALYKDLGWNAAQQAGFNRRTCGKDQPETQIDGNKVYHGLEEMLKRLLRPHYGAFKALVAALMAEQRRGGMTAWEVSFVKNIYGKMDSPATVSPQMVKKVREIAHKLGIECGFPSLRELAAVYNAAHREESREQKVGG